MKHTALNGDAETSLSGADNRIITPRTPPASRESHQCITDCTVRAVHL